MTPIFSRFQIFVVAAFAVFFGACEPVEDTSKAIPPGAKPGPVENIDEAERLAAIELEPGTDEITREIKRFMASVRTNFEKGSFGELQELATELASGSETFGDGTWKLDRFYEAIENRFNNSDAGWLTDLEQHKKWIESEPKSVAAHTALANFWTSYAWRARGGGYSDTVTEKQWQTFGARLDEAAKSLQAVSDTEIGDPAFYSAAMTLALGAGWSAEEFDELVSAALKLNPAYWPIVYDRAYSLLPRWYGEEGDWEKFASTICGEHPELGPAAYAQVVMRIRRFYSSVFRDSKASWPETLKGVELLQKMYPDSEYLVNQVAFLATIGGDRELAEAMFDKMGNRYFASVWADPEQVAHFRTWAETGEW